MGDFKEGDIVILIDKESPKKRAERLNKPYKIKHNREQRVGFFDVIDKIQGNNATTKKRKFKTRNKKTNDEDLTDAQKREERGEPQRKIYYANKEWFPAPHGMQFDLDEVFLDLSFIENVLKPFDQQIREQ